MAALKLIPASGPPLEIDADRTVVGRDKGCDVIVDDVSVSRKHARIERWGSNWAVVDQRSANGTFLDGQRIAEKVLQSGQELRFGAVSYRVEIDEYTAGATVLMHMPAASDATVLQPAAAPRRPAAPAAPAPPPAPAAAPAPAAPLPAPRPTARPAAPPPRMAPTPPVVHPPEPVERGRGPIFWSALGCGGLLLVALLGFGAFFGRGFYLARGAERAVRAQLQDIRNGDLDAAYARTTAGYQADHPAAAFAAFVGRHPGLVGNNGSTFANRAVEGSTARLSGTLAHASGQERVAYELLQEGGDWKVSALEVEGDKGEAEVASVEDGDGLTVEAVGLNKAAQGQAVSVRFDIRVTGFDLRPEGNLFRVDLVEDLETFGPDGRRMDSLSREGLEKFNRTADSATGATATFKNSLTFARSQPGRYRAVITIRDMVGQKSRKHEVTFDLP
jgi:hypothetical protein